MSTAVTLTFDLLTSKSVGVILYPRPLQFERSLKTMGQCVLKLLVGNFCDDDADKDDHDKHFVYAMLHRRHKKHFQEIEHMPKINPGKSSAFPLQTVIYSTNKLILIKIYFI